jgi:hypothetical protein
MKKFVLLLMAALALPVMAQTTANKAETAKLDRSEKTVYTPIQDLKMSPIQINRDGLIVWDFETEETTGSWMALDNDGDGYGWTIDTSNGRNGGSCLFSFSYSWESGGIEPDNWIISEQVPLDGELKFWTKSYSSYYLDVFAVYVCVGEPTSLDAFVKLGEDIEAPGDWTEYTYDMSEYAGQMGCIAFRHYNCYNMWRLFIDDISLGIPPKMPTTPEEVTVEPDVNEASVMWVDEDDVAWNLRYRVYTEPAGYFWDFEDCEGALPEGFTTLDADGDGYDWMLWDPQSLGYDPGDGTALNGTKCAASASYQGGILYPDNWLITPEVTLTGELSFYAGGQDPSYASEVFAVYVSVGDRDWVKISEDITATSPIQKYTFDLSEYEGMTGQVAIRHYNCYDMFRLNIDDILIGEMPDGAEEAEWIVIEGIQDVNYVIENLTESTTYEVQIQAYNENGESDWTGSTTFTTGTPTSIQEIAAEVKGDNRYFNMMGQEVDGNNLPAGIYIHNGKKILVK